MRICCHQLACPWPAAEPRQDTEAAHKACILLRWDGGSVILFADDLDTKCERISDPSRIRILNVSPCKLIVVSLVTLTPPALSDGPQQKIEQSQRLWQHSGTRRDIQHAVTAQVNQSVIADLLCSNAPSSTDD